MASTYDRRMSNVTLGLTPATTSASPPRAAAAWRWAFLAWMAIYVGGMAGLLNHRLDRKFDWNTSFWAISARHLAREGFLRFRGGIYLTAGDMPREAHGFYAGHPPLTAWFAMLWMRLFGESDAALRSLPLAFS